jgi:ubiquinone/menaquinone biosynthesis C-methylase UbiE
MATEHDPEGREPQALLAAADFKNARVLEIGCGDGRLTFRYAGSAMRTIGIDTKPDDVSSAAKNCPSGLRDRLTFLHASATALPFHTETFNIAIFASSL